MFPNKIKASGVGFTISMGALATMICPMIIGFLKRKSIDFNLVFIVLAFVGFAMSFLLEETIGKVMED